MANLLEELVLCGVGLLAQLFVAVAEGVGQPDQRLFPPTTDLGRVDAEQLRDLRGVLCAWMASTATLASG